MSLSDHCHNHRTVVDKVFEVVGPKMLPAGTGVSRHFITLVTFPVVPLSFGFRVYSFAMTSVDS